MIGDMNMNDKKILSVIALALILFVNASAQNPISPMGVYIADPSAKVSSDGRLYIYGSLDKVKDVYCSKDYHVLASTNLREWELYRNSFSWKTDLYAPDAVEKDGKYYLYYDVPSGDEYVATSTSPMGPFTGGELIDGPKQIDPNVFIDDDGQAYYFWGQFSGKGAKLNPDMKSIDKTSIVRGLVDEANHHFHEGSYVVRRGEWYYYTFADISRRNRPTCIGYAMSKNPLGPYEYKGVIVDNYGCDPESWNNHGSIVEYNGQWYVLYHRSTHGSRTLRKACIEPISFREDGTIIEAEMTTQGAAGPLSAFSRLDAARVCLRSGHCRVRLMEGVTDREELRGIHSGDAAAYKYLDFAESGARNISIRVRSHLGGTVFVRTDQKDGKVIAKFKVPAHTDWKTLKAKVASRDTKGVHAIWLTFEGKADPQDAIREAEARKKDSEHQDFSGYAKMLEWREVGGEMPAEFANMMNPPKKTEHASEKAPEKEEKLQVEQADDFELLQMDWFQFEP